MGQFHTGKVYQGACWLFAIVLQGINGFLIYTSLVGAGLATWLNVLVCMMAVAYVSFIVYIIYVPLISKRSSSQSIGFEAPVWWVPLAKLPAVFACEKVEA